MSSDDDTRDYEDEYFQLCALVAQMVSFAWANKCRADPKLPELKEAAKTLNLSGFLYNQLEEMMNDAGFPSSALHSLWAKLLPTFSPPLRTVDELIAQRDVRNSLLRTIFQAWRWRPIFEKVEELKTVAYGWVPPDEMDWLVANFPMLLEMGAGRGRFAYQFRRKGGNILAVDNNSFKQFTPGRQPHAFTQELMDDGCLIIGGVEQLTPERMNGRAVIMLCPAPGSSMPVEVINTFTGEFLIIMMGIFAKVDSQRNWKQKLVKLFQGHLFGVNRKVQNVIEFFHLLATQWQEISEEDEDYPGRPPWKWDKMGGNVLVFKRRQ